jgi:UDP-2,4-diacetamido-2,4,6-trideoxy-beta-L-altropyranose hydrolase
MSDSYECDAACHEVARQAGFRIAVMDDDGRRSSYDVELVINPNPGADHLASNYAAAGMALLGPRYAPLRSEFLAWRGPRTFPEVAKNVLVTCGGSDPANVTVKVIEALARLDGEAIDVQVVVGPSNPKLGLLRRLTEVRGPRVRMVVDAADMPGLMAWADLAISVFGSTSWEMACMGLPNCAVIFAESHIRPAEDLASREILMSLGLHGSLNAERVATQVRGMIHDKAARVRMGAAGQTLIDGDGARRVVRIMRDSAGARPTASGRGRILQRGAGR